MFAATIVLGPVAERLRVPYPILMLVFGLLVAFVPGLPRLDISPEGPTGDGGWRVEASFPLTEGSQP